MKTKIPDFIQNAIKAGEFDAKAIEQQKKTLDDKRRKDDQEYEAKMLSIAREWTINDLPDLIRKETTIGKRELFLGSSDYDNRNINTLTKVKACQELGLGIKKANYKADYEVDGTYSHGDGCSYYVIW